MIKLTKNLGISLLELMLSLAIIAILLVMATRYYSSAQAARQIRAAVSSIQALYSATQQYLIDNGEYPTKDAIDVLIKNDLLPANFKQHANPWTTISAEDIKSDASHLELTFKNAPDTACNNIQNKIKNYFAGSEVTVTCKPMKVTFK